jgi:hypothetical protein
MLVGRLCGFRPWGPWQVGMSVLTVCGGDVRVTGTRSSQVNDCSPLTRVRESANSMLLYVPGRY